MADTKITDLVAFTTPVDTDLFVGVDDPIGVPETKKITWANIKATLKTYFDALYAPITPQWTYLTTPLTSTSWDGDSFSTTAKTLIDLSVVFSVPAGVTAILAQTIIKDSGSAGAECVFILSPNNVAASGVNHRVTGIVNDSLHDQTQIVPCDANGDVYYQVVASGAATMDVIIRIWGYAVR